MNYAYLRVSTDKQDAENQKLGITEYAQARNIQIDKFVEDVVSGTKDWQKRALGELIKSAKGDLVLFYAMCKEPLIDEQVFYLNLFKCETFILLFSFLFLFPIYLGARVLLSPIYYQRWFGTDASNVLISRQ